MKRNQQTDSLIAQYTEALRRLQQGEYDLDIPSNVEEEIGQLGGALSDLASLLRTRQAELEKLDQITARINAGLLLEDILENIYQDFRPFIPYNRIGMALLDEAGKTVRSHWCKSDLPELKLQKGYTAPLERSSLETIIQTGQPRILNDLVAYLEKKPESRSTSLIVAEGMRSSMTCPLLTNGEPIGFLFFSSVHTDTYADLHIETFQRIARQLSVAIEKGRLVSELTAQKAAIQSQNEELRRLDDLKNAFLGMAAHNLRNPIAYIQTAANFIMIPQSNLSDQERTSFLRDISRQTEYILELLNELLDITQIETGKLTLDLKPIQAGAFLTEAVDRQARLAQSKGTRVSLTSVPAGTFVADDRHLRQVIDNLISNAVKYSPPGSTVLVSAERTQTGWRVNVQDEGPGITAEDRQHLFKDFARLSAQPTAGEKSSGLGLAITKRVVEAHGGQIGVDSHPGQGATFWFTLPEQ